MNRSRFVGDFFFSADSLLLNAMNSLTRLSNNGFRFRLFVNIAITFGLMAFLGGLLAIIGFDINNRVIKIQDSRLELAKRNRFISDLADLQRDFNKISQYSSVLENVLPRRDQLFDFSKELEAAARQQNIGLGFIFSNEQAPAEDSPGAASFSLTLQGQSDNVVSFLKKIEMMRFITNFSGLDFTRQGDNVNMSLSGLVYFQ